MKPQCVIYLAYINICPVKYCNDRSSNFVTINTNTCIGCRKYIENCTHEARTYIDDFQKFLDDIVIMEFSLNNL